MNPEEDISENAELLALQKIDDTCVSLQEAGRYLESLECMERGLVLRQHFFGADSLKCGGHARLLANVQSAGHDLPAAGGLCHGARSSRRQRF